MTELSKTYDPQETESRLYAWWEEQGYFTPEIDWDKEPFVISMPPPNVTGSLHIGHAMFVTLEDLMMRYQRMKGRPALWLPGTDHAGIATQLQVERQLAEEGKTRWDVGRDEFEQRVWTWKEEHGGYITRQLRFLGASCDWSREKFTLDADLNRAVIEAFVRLHEQGLIYRGKYLVNWSPNLQTAVSDLEVEYHEEPGTLYYFKYPLADAGEDGHLEVATTRPETILGDTAVAVHPEDGRFSDYVGKTAVVPILEREIPIIADAHVDPEFGTGALKITPGHDPDDWEIGRRHDLDIINIMNKDATLNENAGPYAGLERFEAREKLWADMEEAGLTLRTEPYEMRVPRSQRGGEIIEPLVSTQWFVEMEPLATQGLDAVRDGRIIIIPERFEKVYFHWLENIRDWCISRQLWWGHRIPVWYVNGDEEKYIVAHDEDEAYRKARVEYGQDVTLEQDPDVLDTWFSSGLWPFSTLGWPDEEAEDYRYFYPTTVMETGRDILFFWVARMIMSGLQFTGQAPFETVYLHGLINDAEGRKMSKTLGNVIDPIEVIDEYGADALRFTLATGSTPGQDVNLAMERIEGNRNFGNKIWNATRFVLSNLEGLSEDEFDALAETVFDDESLRELALAERWIVSRLHHVIAETTDLLDRFLFGEAGRTMYNFFWGEFADWYIEASKTRLYSEDENAATNAQRVLVYVLERTLRLLHPYIPFVTEEAWQHLPHWGETIMRAQWPADGPIDEEAIERFTAIQDLIRSIRNVRNEYNVEHGRRIGAIVIADSLRPALEAERDVLASLASLDETGLDIQDELDREPERAVHLVIREGLEAYLPLAGMIDLDQERARLMKEAGDIEGQIERLRTRLANEDFVQKAPDHIVDGAREQLADAEERLGRVRERLEMLEGLS